MTAYPVMSTMGVGRGIVFPNDSAWRLQPPATREMVELWSGNSGLSTPPPMMRTGVYGMGADGSVWEYAPTAAGGMTQLFNGQNLPVITGISPSSGPAGTSLTITGSGFTGATAVKFGSTNATSFTVNSDTSITAVSPSVTGAVNITVTTAGGTSIGGAPSQFTGLITPTTWNPSDVANGSVSGGNLTVTSTIGFGGVRGIKGITAGKYYFEGTMNNWTNVNTSLGIANLAMNLSSLGSGSTPTAAVVFQNGGIIIGNNSSGFNLGPRASGNIIGVAVDTTAQLIWFRVCPSGNWNNNAGANPATGTGGAGYGSFITGAVYPSWGSGTGSEQATANFGATAFSGAVPSGFTAGWGS